MSHRIRYPESKLPSFGGGSPDGVEGREGEDGATGASAAHRWARLIGRPVSRRLVVGAIISVGLVAAACGSSPTSAVSNTSTTGSKAASVPATTIGSTTNPTLGTILVNAAGATLYRFAADQNGQSSCTGACAQLWPPFTVTAGSQPKGSGMVGVFATSKRADGTLQVTYNGSPLYTFSGDKPPGSTAGQGVLGMWFVVNVSATPVAAAPTTTAPAGASTTTTRAPSTPAITPNTAAQQPAPTSPAPTSPPPTAPPATSPPPTTSPPTTAPPATTTPTTMGYGY